MKTLGTKTRIQIKNVLFCHRLFPGRENRENFCTSLMSLSARKG